MPGRLEKEFADLVEVHGEQVAKAFHKAKDVSEKYGIPFGSYIPRSFKKFRSRNLKKGEPQDTEHENYWGEEDNCLYGVDCHLVDKLCDMDNGWLSSTTECEFNYE